MRHALLGCALGCAASLAAADTLDLTLKLDPATRTLEAEAKISPPPSAGWTLAVGLEPLPDADGRSWRAAARGPDWVRWHKPGASAIRYRGTLPGLDGAGEGPAPVRPAVDARGSVLPEGSGWYPAPAAAAFDWRLRLRLPPGQRGVASGRRLREAAHADGYRAEFASEAPDAGPTLLTGPWELGEAHVARAGSPPLRVRSYFAPAVAGLAEGYRDAAAAALMRYSAAIGPYPHADFTLVSSPLPLGVALPGMTALGEDVLRLPFIRASSLAHEVLHQWWGLGVRIDAARGNWAEGLTTLMADYAAREAEGAAAARALRLDWLRDFAAVPTSEDVALSAFGARFHGASQIVGYRKAAFALLLLRETIGAETFERALRLYFWPEQRGRAASWDDLIDAFELASGRSLARFKADWIDRPGLPSIAIEDAATRPAGEDGLWPLRLKLRQDAPARHLRLPLAITTSAGTELYRVEFDAIAAELTLWLDQRPDALVIDPDYTVPRRLAPEELPASVRDTMVAAAPRLAVLDTDAQYREAARALAARLLDAPARDEDGAGALLLVGPPAAVDGWLGRHGLSRPREVGSGRAHAWAARLGDRPLLVVSAADATRLAELARRLPHYGRQGWLVLDDAGRVGAKGDWAAPLRRYAVREEAP